ncbi:TylF/MycF/NovP-related O-methyltransferase [Trinickia mobilis]|uniref:TylF/MycF/NovP-related O-methyltransferase n=1 Tax=Trinickia mobilis TaxID=2816356 RepID=UPI001A8FF8F2|nr:TylF/MycF/NovP-related O-methyltransferase [Trinickia mobilis]
MDKTSPDFLSVLRAERRDLLNRFRQTRFESLIKNIDHTQVIPFATYSPWLSDETFCRAFESIKANTLVDTYRCYELYRLAQQTGHVAGDIVEVGVWRGGTAALIAQASPEKVVHLFDTFTGVAKNDSARDTLYSGGEHADTNEQIVKDLFSKVGRRCEIHRGIFPDDTLSRLPANVCFAHIDVDTYSSVKQSFGAIWPRVQRNGIVVFDDYGFFGCEGATQAVNEIVVTHANELFIHNLNGHALLVRQTESN